MRIIAGKYARRALQSPSWEGVRPLLSRLRRSLFDTISPYLRRGPFLDLFGGTGAFAFEALSRGAPQATVVELDPRSAKLIQQNAKDIGVQEPIELLQGDALEWLPQLAKQGRQYAVISIAPPYHQGLEQTMLGLLDQHAQLLHPEGIAFIQLPSQETLDVEICEHLQMWRMRQYGNTKFYYFFPALEDEAG